MEKLEKDFDDYVYEDELYEENYEEENIENKDDVATEEEEPEDDGHSAIIVCKDCANQWEDFLNEGEDENSLFCPLCGSNNVSHEVI